MRVIVNLCKEIVLALDLDSKDEEDEEIVYDSEVLKQCFYVFYLDCVKNGSKDIGKEECDGIRNNFALFVMLQKQNAVKLGFMTEAICEALAVVAENISKFLEGVALKNKHEVLLVLLDNIINSIDKANVQDSLKSFVSGCILIEKQHLELLVSDLELYSSSEFYKPAHSLIMRKISEWEDLSQSILSDRRGLNLTQIMNNCKKNSQDLQFLIASVIFI